MRHNKITNLANRWFLTGLSLAWTMVLLISYWAYHPYYSVALGRFPNLDVAATLLAVCGLAALWLHRGKGGRRVNGLMLYGFIMLLQLVAMVLSGGKYGLSGSNLPERLAYFLGFNLYLHAAFFLVVVLHFAVGNLLVRHLATWYSRDSLKVLSLATGLSISGFVLVLLGLFGWLHPWLLWLLAVGILAWQRRAAWEFIYDVMWRPMRGAQEGIAGTTPIFLILAATSLANIAAIKAFPQGFDGIGLYMNTTHLIATYQALPQGGQAFNWSVFMSLGELMFGLEAISILFSHFSIFFCLFALYRISRLFFSRALSWLIVLAFYLNPAVSFHLMYDEKVDLGFLFITLGIALLLLEYKVRLAGKKPLPEKQPLFQLGKWVVREHTLIWALAGWLAGYAFGIKYIGLITAYAVVVYATYQKAGSRAAAGALGLLLSSFFVLGVYRYGYLDLEGVSPLAFAGLTAVPGLLLLAWGLRGRIGQLKPISHNLGLFGLLMVFSFSPWAGKNLYENGEFNFHSVAQGVLPTPKIVIGWKEVAGESLIENVLRVFGEQNIALTDEQLQLANTIVGKYTFTNKTVLEQQAESYQARDEIITRVLTAEQQAIITGKAPPPEKNQAGRGPVTDEDKAFELMVKNLSRKGVELSAAQSEALTRLFSGVNFKGLSLEERKRIVAQLREETISQILTVQQRQILEGKVSASKAAVEPPAALSGGQREEIKRYIGYEAGLPLYLSLPYDLTMNTNVILSQFVDVGFLFLLLFVVLLFSRRLWQNVLLAGALFVAWVFSVYSLYAAYGTPETGAVKGIIAQSLSFHHGALAGSLGKAFSFMQLNLLQVGLSMRGVYEWMSGLSFIYTFGFLLAAAALIYYLLKGRLESMSSNFKGMLAFTFAFAFFWVLMGNAIVWYAFPVLALLLVFFTYFYRHPDKLMGKAMAGYSRYWLWGAMGLYLLLSLSLRFINTTQPEGSRHLLFQKPFIQFATQYQSKEQTYAYFIPMMEETIRTLNSQPQDKIYRVGTYFNYHIRFNDRRVLEDNQLEQYGRIAAQLDNKEAFLQTLKDNGYRYILYDLNTGSIDRTPEQSLRRKAQEFLGLLLQSPQVNILYSDNLVEDPNGGYVRIGNRAIQAKPGLSGRVINQGSYVLFELLP
jgi:hypothetical protein